jgi:hypothetical protein
MFVTPSVLVPARDSMEGWAASPSHVLNDSHQAHYGKVWNFKDYQRVCLMKRKIFSLVFSPIKQSSIPRTISRNLGCVPLVQFPVKPQEGPIFYRDPKRGSHHGWFLISKLIRQPPPRIVHCSSKVVQACPRSMWQKM